MRLFSAGVEFQPLCDREEAAQHEHQKVEGLEGPVTVPVSAFKFADDGPSVDSPPPRLGQHTEEVLLALGYTTTQIAALREEDVI